MNEESYDSGILTNGLNSSNDLCIAKREQDHSNKLLDVTIMNADYLIH